VAYVLWRLDLWKNRFLLRQSGAAPVPRLHYTQKDLDLVNEGSLYSVTHLLSPLEALDYESVTRFKCPIFVFEGWHDYAVSHTVAEEWFKRIEAPSKKLVWFDDSAHMPMQEEPGDFCTT
jgi:proline iminopeptidase